MLLFPSTSIPPGGAAYAPPFTPASLNPTAWWDFSDISNMYQDTAGTAAITASGQSIGRVNDKSGNGFNLLQATSGSRPVYTTGGGLSWGAFTGSSSQFLAAVTPQFGLNTLGLYAAFACTASSNSNCGLLSLGSATSGADWNSSDACELQINGATTGIEFYGNNHYLYPNPTGGVPSPAVAEATMTGGTSTGAGAGALIVNGTAVSSAIGQSYGFASKNGGNVAAGARVSAGPATYGYYYTGKIYQLLIFSNGLTSSQISRLRTWLGSKCGLSL